MIKLFPYKKIKLTANISNDEYLNKLVEIINNDLYTIRLYGQHSKNSFHITHHVFNNLFNLWYNGRWENKDNELTLEIDVKYELESKIVYFILNFIILIIIYFIGYWLLLLVLVLPYAYIASFISEDSFDVIKCLTQDLNAKSEIIESTNLYKTFFRYIRKIFP